MTTQSLTQQCQWQHKVWLSGVNDNTKSDSAVSMTPNCFFAHVNVSTKSKLYAKILHHVNTKTRWVQDSWKNGGLKSHNTVILMAICSCSCMQLGCKETVTEKWKSPEGQKREEFSALSCTHKDITEEKNNNPKTLKKKAYRNSLLVIYCIIKL